MTLLPGVTVTISSSPPPSAPTDDTGTAFIAGLSERGIAAGPLGPGDAFTSLGDWITANGALQSYNGPDYAAVEGAFADGASRVFWSRKVGPAAVLAHASVPASSSQFTAYAKSFGSWANSLTVGVASNVVTVKLGGVIVEVSPVLADLNALVVWASTVSAYLSSVTLLVSNTTLTNSADVSLTLGADDRTNITDTQIQTALDRFVGVLGPGQVTLPGDGRIQAYTMIAAHCAKYNRWGYGDAPDTAVYTDVTTLAASVQALGLESARHLQLLDPWLTFPGINGGANRTVPPSASMLGLAARCDSLGNPNRAIAGPRFASRYALDAKYHRTDAERTAYAAAGITPFVVLQGQVMPYDDVMPVNQITFPQWVGAAGGRMVMRIISDAVNIGQSHLFDEVDGQNFDFVAFGGDLEGMLLGWYGLGSLFGDTPADAFRVDVGSNVNTPGPNGTIAKRQLNSALSLVLSPNARAVNINITNTPLGLSV